jgi:hypothetical protein
VDCPRSRKGLTSNPTTHLHAHLCATSKVQPNARRSHIRQRVGSVCFIWKRAVSGKRAMSLAGSKLPRLKVFNFVQNPGCIWVKVAHTSVTNRFHTQTLARYVQSRVGGCAPSVKLCHPLANDSNASQNQIVLMVCPRLSSRVLLSWQGHFAEKRTDVCGKRAAALALVVKPNQQQL